MAEHLLSEGMETIKVPLELVHDYFRVLRGEYLAEYEAAKGMLDDVLFTNTPTGGSYECDTAYTIDALVDYQHRQTPERQKIFNNWRKFSAAHVVRGMIQGSRFPTGQFDKVISGALSTMASIDGVWEPSKLHKGLVLGQILDIWNFERRREGDPDIARRAAEAYKYVGRPRAYGRMMTRVARKERKADSH